MWFTCLCDCLHPPPGVAHLPHYPLCIYTCVLCLSVDKSTSIFVSTPAFLQSLFWPLPVLTFCLPAWPLCLSLTLSLPSFALPLDYQPLPDRTLTAVLYLCPCCCNKHCYFETVCIWVLPWYLIIHVKLIYDWANICHVYNESSLF